MHIPLLSVLKSSCIFSKCLFFGIRLLLPPRGGGEKELLTCFSWPPFYPNNNVVIMKVDEEAFAISPACSWPQSPGLEKLRSGRKMTRKCPPQRYSRNFLMSLWSLWYRLWDLPWISLRIGCHILHGLHCPWARPSKSPEEGFLKVTQWATIAILEIWTWAWDSNQCSLLALYQ